MSFKIFLKKFDFPLIFFPILISLLGIIFLYSLGLAKNNFLFFKKQIIFLILGILSSLLISLVPAKALKESNFFIFFLYFFSLILLSGLFIFGKEIRGQKGWYFFGPFSFEPVEFVKLFLVLFFAKFFSTRYIELYQAKHIFFSAFYLAPLVLLVFFQPDLGSALILVLLWFSMLLISGIKRKHLVLILEIGILLFLILWNFFLGSEGKSRIITFLEPYLNPQREYLDPQKTGYHIKQSLIAIGSGGLFGKGFFNILTQSKLGYLPEAHSDFIFAGFGEMFGFFGILLFFFLFLALFWRLYKVSNFFEENFSRLFISGFSLLIFIHFFINIGMNLGLLPIIGISLPFFSYGGSSLIFFFFGIGIVESFCLSRP